MNEIAFICYSRSFDTFYNLIYMSTEKFKLHTNYMNAMYSKIFKLNPEL